MSEKQVPFLKDPRQLSLFRDSDDGEGPQDEDQEAASEPVRSGKKTAGERGRSPRSMMSRQQVRAPQRRRGKPTRYQRIE